MNIRSKGYWLGALLAATCVFSSCTKNDDANDENTVSNNYIIVKSSVLMSGNSQSEKIDLEANCEWKVEYQKGSWTDLIVSPTSGNGNTTVIIESSVNNTEADRYVDLKFSTVDGDLPRVCKVTQQMGDFVAELAFESLEGNTVTIPYTGQEKDFEKSVVDIVNEHDFKDDCVITSQSYSLLKKVKEYDDSIHTVYVMAIAYGNILRLRAADNFSIKSLYVTDDLVKRVHNSGKQLYVWTVNSRAGIDRMLDLNVDNIITDNITLAKECVYRHKTGNTLIKYLDMLILDNK